MTVAALREIQATAAQVARARAWTTGLRGEIADDVLELVDLILSRRDGGR